MVAPAVRIEDWHRCPQRRSGCTMEQDMPRLYRHALSNLDLEVNLRSLLGK